MAVWGADVAGLQAVAADLRRYGDAVEQARASIDAQLARTAWQGQNADSFRWRWRTIAVRDLDGFRSDCIATASELDRQASEQLAASARLHGSGTTHASVAGRGVTSLALSMMLRGGLGPAAALAGSPMTPATLQAARDLYFPDLIGTATTITGVGIDYIKTGALGSVLPVNVMHGNLNLGLSKAHLLTNAANKSLVNVASHGLSGGVAAITSGFSQWNRDVGSGLSTSEQATRASTVAGVNAVVSIGVGTGVGALTAMIPVVGPIAAPWVGKAAAAGAVYALERTGANERIADRGSTIDHSAGQAREGFGVMADTAVELGGQAREGFGVMADTAVELGGQAVDGARDLVRDAGQVMDDVKGRITSGMSGAARRFNPFAD